MPMAGGTSSIDLAGQESQTSRFSPAPPSDILRGPQTGFQPVMPMAGGTSSIDLAGQESQTSRFSPAPPDDNSRNFILRRGTMPSINCSAGVKYTNSKRAAYYHTTIDSENIATGSTNGYLITDDDEVPYQRRNIIKVDDDDHTLPAHQGILPNHMLIYSPPQEPETTYLHVLALNIAAQDDSTTEPPGHCQSRMSQNQPPDLGVQNTFILPADDTTSLIRDKINC